MKKYNCMLYIVILTVIFSSGCGNRSGNQPSDTSGPGSTTGLKTVPDTAVDELKLQDYFPMQTDTMYFYEGVGNEFASYNLYNDYLSEDKVQQRISNAGTEAIRVIELKEGKLTRVFYRGEAYYRENFLNTVEGDPEIMLMEPLIVGNFWTLKGSVKRTITNTEAEIATPIGSFKTIEVTTDTPQGKNLDYYAKNIGLVKSVFKSGEIEVTSTLKKIDTNVTLKSTVNFYYPVKAAGELHYIGKLLEFRTNDITRKLLEEAYSNLTKSLLGEPVSDSIKINSLYLGNDNIVYIDLSSAFITEVNKHRVYENAVLQSIANTFGGYYNSDKVNLTIDNKNYKSDGFSMKQGETLKVGLEGSIQDELK
jgi:hypothetical protein